MFVSVILCEMLVGTALAHEGETRYAYKIWFKKLKFTYRLGGLGVDRS